MLWLAACLAYSSYICEVVFSHCLIMWGVLHMDGDNTDLIRLLGRLSGRVEIGDLAEPLAQIEEAVATLLNLTGKDAKPVLIRLHGHVVELSERYRHLVHIH